MQEDSMDQPELAECSSLFSEPADSIRIDFEEPALNSTPRKRREELIAKWSALWPVFESKPSESAMDDTFDLSNFLSKNSAGMDNLLDTTPPMEVVDDESLLDTIPPSGIVANDSLVLTQKRLADNVGRIEDDNESFCSAGFVIAEDVSSFELSHVLADSGECLMDVSLSSLMEVEINYSLEFPTGALGRAPHIFVPKYKRDMKRKAAAEAALEKKDAIPSLMVTSPSDGDLCFDNGAELREFEIQDIVNQSFKDHLLDGSWRNWSMRFDFENVLRELEELEASSNDVNEVY
jgi:hypothetical protein